MNLKLSYNWLNEYLKSKKSVQEFAREMSLKCQSVERITELGKGLDGVVVGKILTVEKHPNADKLSIAKVDIGKSAPLQIVFGQMAKIKAGDRLPVVVAPAVLPTGQAIKKSNLRGVESQGMLCLDSELGLSDQERVSFFDETVAPGTPIAKAMGLNDYLLNIEVTSNRPDAMSVVGLAREGAAALGLKFDFKPAKPDLKVKEALPLAVELKEPKLCLRYQAVVMTGIKVGPSPLWLQLRLTQSGLRPINNLVDITNYILLEYGRPMHVFNYDKLQDNKIIIRKAKSGEKILALDGKVYELKPEMLVIADAKAPVAVAGIMGGEESAATEKTKTIVFECAAFDPVLIRKTARALNLHSESSSLFEKNLHPQSTYPAMLRAIELTQQLSGGQVAAKIIDTGIKNYKPAEIKLDPAQVERRLGIKIPSVKIKNILASLGFAVAGAKILAVTVPWWRANDVQYDYDLVEEVARIYGYHNLPVTLSQGEIPPGAKEQILFWEENVKNILKVAGLTESLNYSMVSEKLLAKSGFGAIKPLKIANPLNEDMEYLRPSLIPGILQNVADNIKNFSEFKIFELSNVYLPAKANDLPDESARLCGAIVADSENPFFWAKGLAELLLKKLGLTDYELKLTDQQCPLWQKQAALDIMVGSKFVGQFGLFAGDILEKFGIIKPVAVFDFDFRLLAQMAKAGQIYTPIPEFPSVSRDLAVIIDQSVSWQAINEAVSHINSLIVGIEYLSTFIGKDLPADKKSLAFRVTFRATDRTLKSEEVDEIMKKLVAKLEKEFTAKLR